MAHQQERNRGVVRVILEQDAGFTAWLSDQLGGIRTLLRQEATARQERFDALDNHLTQLETRMKTIEDYAAEIKASQDDTLVHVDAIKQDVIGLLAAVAAIPPQGLTQAQADLLETVTARGRSIAASAAAVDAMSPVAPPSPAPTPEPAPPTSAGTPGSGL